MVKITLRDAEGTEFGAEEETSVTLSEELVEKIIARMPFPSIFKARLLSQSWWARFRPLSSFDTGEEKLQRRAKHFQKLVTERSINWDTFCLVCTRIEFSVVYNQAQQKWQALPRLHLQPHLDKLLLALQPHLGKWLPPFLQPHPDKWSPTIRTREFEPNLEGAYLYDIIDFFDDEYPYTICEGILLVNILTGDEQMELVLVEQKRTHILFIKLVIDPSLETYKMVVFCRVSEPDEEDGDEGQHYLRVYDSKSDLWKCKSCFGDDDVVPDWDFLSCTFHNGVLYMLTKTSWDYVLAINLENGAIEELIWTSTLDLKIDAAILVSLDDSLLIIGTEGNREEGGTCVPDGTRVVKIDLVSLQLLEVALCPTLQLDGVNARSVTSQATRQADSVFFNVCLDYDHIVEYNKRKKEWRAFSVGTHNLGNIYRQDDGYFRPGLNPFMELKI